MLTRAAVHGKRAEMCPPDTAERLTGYVVGGISPFGQKRALPVVIDDAIAIRSMAHLALTFDHRLIDGALADQFMMYGMRMLGSYQVAPRLE